MISISGIKYQKELEAMPYLNKQSASVLIGKKGKNLDKKIARLIEIGYLKTLKKGLYVSSSYIEKTEKESYLEYIANILRVPSYITAEYVLSRRGIIPEVVYSVTSITNKTSRRFTNFMGSFIYKNIKEVLFTGFEEIEWGDNTINIATTGKALFDFFYLKKIDSIKEGVLDTRINLENLAKKDLMEFNKYVKLSGSIKMGKIYKELEKLYAIR